MTNVTGIGSLDTNKNEPSPVQIMAWHLQILIGTNGGLMHWRKYASLGLKELMQVKVI